MPKLSAKDQVFITRLTEIVIANIRDESFSAEKLAKEAGMSRASLYRKLHAIINKDISQFIREVRLTRAREMLQNNEGNVSDIAFRVGFGSPTYFSKCFHDHYGYPPGQVRFMMHLSGDDADRSEGDQSTGTKSFENAANGRKKKVMVFSAAGLVLVLIIILSAGLHLTLKDQSIFILPFKNLSDNLDNQYIADGLREDILNDLYHISMLDVRSRTTSDHFRVTNLTSREIAKKVRVRNVLEGSIREYDNKLRISVQLIDARKDSHLWSANYDRLPDDILGLQRDISMQVAEKLSIKLSDNEIKEISEIPTQNPVAYRYFQKARFLRYKSEGESRVDISREGLLTSIQYYEKAVAEDENFAEAWAGMAAAWNNLSGWRWLPDNEGFLKARELSRKALEIDPNCAEAHGVKGSYHIWGERNFEEGRKELLAAIHLNPNYSPAYQSYAQLLMITGPIEEARKYIDMAMKLEPYYWVLHNLNAWIYYFENKPLKAIEACRTAKDLKPDYIFTDWLLFLNFAKLGDGMKATETLQEILRLSARSNKYDAEISNAYSVWGVEGLFSWLIEININRPLPAAGLSGHPFFIAWWYAILGNKEKSVYWLEMNMSAKTRLYEYFNLIATNPDFDILRDNARFLKIIDDIGLKEYNTRRAR